MDQAIADVKQIVSNSNEFGVSLAFTSPTGTTATITGLHTKHHLSVDNEGNPTNSKRAYVSFSESSLTDAGYTVRNSRNEVDLKGHKVVVRDSAGNAPTYIIREWQPDEALGLIVCFLDDLAA